MRRVHLNGNGAWLAAVAAVVGLGAPVALAEEQPAPDAAGSGMTLRGVAELGFLAALDHKIQFGRDGTYIDYVAQGGQDNLFAVSRLSLDLRMGDHQEVVLLYQPLSIRTSELLRDDIVVDGLTYPAGTGMNFTYDFPFYRASWMYDFDADPRGELAFGISLQIRNATITFESTDGTRYRTNHDIGPVPILKGRWKHDLGSGYWAGAEADGFYAPVSYLNGDNNEVVGAILDASLRVGRELPGGAEAFLNLRYLGGGAVGQSDNFLPPADGYVRNWLHFMTLTAGFTSPSI